MLSLRDQCAHWSWQSPYLEGKCTEKHQKWEFLRVLTVIVTLFLSTGGLPGEDGAGRWECCRCCLSIQVGGEEACTVMIIGFCKLIENC